MSIFLCCNSSIFIYMAEYLHSISMIFASKTIIFDSKDEFTIDRKNVYIFIQKIPIWILNFEENNIYLLNTEQLSINEHNLYITNIANNNTNIGLIDYSMGNISFIKNNKINYLPYQYNKIDIDKLSYFKFISLYKYDVVIVGAQSKRRQYIYDGLRTNGINITFLDKIWGDKRDYEISCSKILLNIHFADNYLMYEPLRCDRWIFSGMFVISESSFEDDKIDISDLIIFSNYENLIQKVTHVVQNYDSYLEKFVSKREEHLNIIIKQRIESANNLNLLFSEKLLSNQQSDPKSLLHIQNIKYGLESNVIDISTHKNFFYFDNTIRISKNIFFNKIFGDPCPNIKKIIYLDVLYDNILYRYHIPELNGLIIEDICIQIHSTDNKWLYEKVNLNT